MSKLTIIFLTKYEFYMKGGDCPVKRAIRVVTFQKLGSLDSLYMTQWDVKRHAVCVSSGVLTTVVVYCLWA